MFCNACGQQNEEKVRVCEHCGASLLAAEGSHSKQPDHTVPVHLKSSEFAILSMIFGMLGLIVSWFTFALPSLLAVIFGHIARSRIRRSQGLLAGGGRAFAGLIMGYLVFFPIFLIIIIELPPFQKYLAELPTSVPTFNQINSIA